MKRINYVALLLLTGLFFNMSPLSAQVLTADSLALVALYNKCGGTSWTGYETWLAGPVSTWKDVTVGDVGGQTRVKGVALTGMKLTGELPEELGTLTGWSGRFDLHNQPELTGKFPAFIWNLTNVERVQIKFCGYSSIDTIGIHKMTKLYEINTQGTPFVGEVPASIFKLPKMKDIYLEDGKWTSLPANISFPTPTPLNRFYINGNQFNALPDLSGIVFATGTKIKVYGNNFTFEDLAPLMSWKTNSNVSSFTYSPQRVVGAADTTYVKQGAPVTLTPNVGGTGNTYTWLKGENVVAETENYTIQAFNGATNEGVYHCVVQNPTVTGLDISTAIKTLSLPLITKDSLALVALYNKCGGTTWTGFETWLAGPVSTWKDVTVGDVNGQTRVKGVALTGMKLTGELPEELGTLTGWSGRFDLHNQPNLTGQFPAFIWNLTNVERVQIKFCGYSSIDTTGIHKMTKLYEFNTQGTPFVGEVPASIFKLPKMKDIYLEDGKWSSLPANISFPTPTPLNRFYINGNEFSALPDLSGIVFATGTKIKVYGNNLTFEDLEPLMTWKTNSNVSSFTYSPQRVVGTKAEYKVKVGSPINISVSVGGTNNIYSWMKDGQLVEGAETNELKIASAQLTNAGVYVCVIQNSVVTGLDLQSDEQKVVVEQSNGISEMKIENLKIFNSPMTESIDVSASKTIDSYRVYSIDGRTILSENVNSQRFNISLAGHAATIYFVQLKSGDLTQTIKVVKK